MITTIAIMFALISMGAFSWWLRARWSTGRRRALAWLAWALDMTAVAVSFYCGKAGVLPNTLLSAVVVYAAAVYFSIHGYLLMRSLQAAPADLTR